MKRIIKIWILIGVMFSITGCFTEDKLTNDNVYTTIYPIQFLTNYLYGGEKTVASIYPNGADVNNYELTKKQKEVYHKGALFVYNGLTNEKELAREFLNDNKDILLIDVAYGLNFNDGIIEELWLSPNNYLMLAKNIKYNLIEYTTSKMLVDEIEGNYKKLEEVLSYMDANLRNIATQAKNEENAVLLVSSSKLKFLEKYGFEVIVLDNENINQATIRSNFKNEKYKDIYVCSTDKKNDFLMELEKTYKANIINVNMLYTLTDTDVTNNENYLTIMEDLIGNIRNTTLG